MFKEFLRNYEIKCRTFEVIMKFNLFCNIYKIRRRRKKRREKKITTTTTKNKKKVELIYSDWNERYKIDRKKRGANKTTTKKNRILE